TALAPGFAQALTGPSEPLEQIALEPLDRGLLDRARTSVARWLGLTDRLPPGELIDLILRESAYVFEMRGRRLDEARENVKKARALVRRVEKRDYATAA